MSDSLRPMDCSTPSFPAFHHLPEFAQTHVHLLVMPSNHLILCRPLLLLLSIFPSIRFFSNVLALHIRWLKYWNFSFSISPSNEYLRLISLIGWGWLVWSLCCPRDSQESSPAPQLENISSLVLSLLYGLTLTSLHDYWKNCSFDCMDLCQQNDVSAF